MYYLIALVLIIGVFCLIRWMGGSTSPEDVLEEVEPVFHETYAQIEGRDIVVNREGKPLLVLYLRSDEGENYRLSFSDKDRFAEFTVGRRDRLLLQDGRLFDFADLLSTEGDGDVENLDMPFSYDGYDEELDREIPLEQLVDGEAGAVELDPGEAEEQRLFQKAQPLAPRTVQAQVPVEEPASYSGERLLQGLELPRFLKGEPGLQKMFRRAWSAAWTDLCGYDGGGRQGKAAELEDLSGSEFRLVLQIREEMVRGGCLADVELHINEAAL